jgi:hypothetical protein
MTGKTTFSLVFPKRKARITVLKVETGVANPHHFNADPDPAFYSNANPDPAFHFNEDPDPFPYQIDANLRSLYKCTYTVRTLYRPSKVPF